ncbi:YdeI/OmpD-associated family protein [Pedobacter montanisoli]|uniref:YdeI/OmpD-associated family protein n=1 Tax=Pedobacter montanisoli TaxID=2923277 RepID=A0ABS9ZVT9_9SPHI|nr:YdeI/OmpD-associated family protein [Pedobacter montanisoli]MCJ0742412.1 YdeI/OmpD-associated family protein [Pedobacter montanisoli]
MHQFKAPLDIIGINPFVYVPVAILEDIFVKAGKNKGHIPVCGMINHQNYKQTLVKYAGEWRLYINTKMLKNSPKRIGEMVHITVQYDTDDRSIKPHPKFTEALAENPEAEKIFLALPPYLQKEIIRYISGLKSEESINRNIAKAIDFLLGKGRFVGRDKP